VRGHAGEVSLEPVEIEEQRGGRDLVSLQGVAYRRPRGTLRDWIAFVTS
jgi:hypothetical protein